MSTTSSLTAEMSGAGLQGFGRVGSAWICRIIGLAEASPARLCVAVAVLLGAASGANAAQQDVLWTKLVGTSASGSDLTKTARTTAWDSGASSRQILTSDGYVEFTASETALRRIVGLSHEDASPGTREINYAIYLKNDGTIAVHESGVSRGILGTYATGDRFRIGIESGVVKYYRNGALFYTSTVVPTFPLRLDTSFCDPAGTVMDAVLLAVPGPPGPPVAIISAPEFGRVGVPLTFDASDSWDPDGSVIDYAWDFGDGSPMASGATVTHTYSAGGPFTVHLTVTDDLRLPGGASQEEKISQPVVWQNQLRVSASGNSLTKTTTVGWNAGASSVQAVSGDGFAEFTAQETTLRRFVGLNFEDLNTSAADLDYALYLKNDGTIAVYEFGVSRGILSSYATGDRLRIAVESGVVRYYRNGMLFYESAVPATVPLRVDTSICDPGATVMDVTVFTRVNAMQQVADLMLAQLEPNIAWFLSDQEDGLPRNPAIAFWMEEKIAMLQDPSLAGQIRAGKLYTTGSVRISTGVTVPIVAVFPSEGMRDQAAEMVQRASLAVPILETFLGRPFEPTSIQIWYGFIVGTYSGAGTSAPGAITLEDRTTYVARTAVHPVATLYEACLDHELAHKYIGHESLTGFLEIFVFNQIATSSSDVSAWSYTKGDYVAFSSTNWGWQALIDVYQILGRDAMGRAYDAIYPLMPQYGVVLPSACKQMFIDEAPPAERDRVAAILARVTY